MYICELPSGIKSVFLIQDMFPITEEYVEREYTLVGKHLVLMNEKDIESIAKKAKTVKQLISRGVKITPTSPNVKHIIELLADQH